RIASRVATSPELQAPGGDGLCDLRALPHVHGGTPLRGRRDSPVRCRNRRRRARGVPPDPTRGDRASDARGEPDEGGGRAAGRGVPVTLRRVEGVAEPRLLTGLLTPRRSPRGSASSVSARLGWARRGQSATGSRPSPSCLAL